MSERENKRIVELVGAIDTESSQKLKAELLALDNKDPLTPIELHIDSPGGSVLEALAILETIKGLHAPIHTVCKGMCVGSAALVYASGKNGNRTASSNASFMFPEVSGGVSGSEGQLQQYIKSLQNTQDTVTAIFAETTGHSRQDAAKLFNNNKAYSATEAKQVGLVDQVLNIKPS
jgi:ATP-dependent Clp protease protease subunit